MANLMAYPSAAQGMSEGLQSGVSLGIQMRKQREEEDMNTFQKQKFQEQQETQKTLFQIDNNIKLLTTKGIAKATKVKIWNDTNKLKVQLGGSDMGELTSWNENSHDKLASDISNIYALTKDKTKPLSLIDVDKLMNERIMQAYSDGELTSEERKDIENIAKMGKGMVSQDAETQALDALTGKPMVAGFEDPNRQIPITVTPTTEDINQTLSSTLPFIQGEGAVKKQIVERMLPKDMTQTKDVHIGGGLWQEMQYNPQSKTYNIPLGQPYDKAVLKKAGASNVNVNTDKKFLGSIADKLGEDIVATKQAAVDATKTITASHQIKSAIDVGGIILGPTATLRTKGAQITQMLGFTGDDALEQTRNAIQGVAKLALGARQSLKGQGQISDMETKLLQKAESVDGIENITVPELKLLADVAERGARLTIKRNKTNQKKLSTYQGGSEMADFLTVEEPPEYISQKKQKATTSGNRFTIKETK